MLVKGKDLKLGDWVVGSIPRKSKEFVEFDSPYCLLAHKERIIDARMYLCTHFGRATIGGFIDDTTYEVIRIDTKSA